MGTFSLKSPQSPLSLRDKHLRSCWLITLLIYFFHFFLILLSLTSVFLQFGFMFLLASIYDMPLVSEYCRPHYVSFAMLSPNFWEYIKYCFFLFVLWYLYLCIFVYVHFVCIKVGTLHVWISWETKSMQILQDWNYRQLQVTLRVLKTKTWSNSRKANALKLWVTSKNSSNYLLFTVSK